MVRISLIALVLLTWAACSQVQAQCQGGGGGTAASTASTGTTTGGTTAGSAQLLTGPGSWAYNVMMAQAIQRQIAQRQYIAAVQKQAERQADLEKRRYAAVHSRLKTQEQRQRMYAFLAAKYGSPKSSASATYQTAYRSSAN